MLRSLATAALVASTLFLTGCVVSVKSHGTHSYASDTHRTVNPHEFASLVEQNKHVHLGMHRDEALAQYPADLVTKFDAATYDARTLEVWQVYAYSDSKNAKFERWLYFVDGTLVEMSRSEVDYDDDPAILDRWMRN